MTNPVSTYRLQFHKDFTFNNLERIIPYLHQLGVGTVYASPITEAVPGSVHGYDSVNPHRVNPEIGTEDQLKALSQRLSGLGINWLQDIVPNHMAFDPHNPWLMDVLEKGQRSIYAPFFDINWTSPVHDGRLMVPFLGSPLAEIIDKNELSVAWQKQRLVITYYETAYPLHLRSYATVFGAAGAAPSQAMQTLLADIQAIEAVTDPKQYSLRCAEFQTRIAAQISEESPDYLTNCLNAVNTDPAYIREITDEQAYELCYHAETDQRINYRRFFTVNGLICLNIQNPVVFEHFHKRLKLWLDQGIFQGLRVDHIDGLSDPSRYLTQLRELAGDDAYIVIEKILQANEELPRQWPIQGETGYAYLSMVNNLFTRISSQAKFTRFYTKLLGEKLSVRREVLDKKAYILSEHMQGELNNLHQLFLNLNLVDTAALDALPPDSLKDAIGEFLTRCPVYRYYGNSLPLADDEATAVRGIFTRIRQANADLAPAVDQLEEALLTKPAAADADYRQRALRFYQRSMQFTGPLMAKGVEDTLMYVYNRFIGHDEVGDSPEYFGLTVDAFHQKMVDRQANWPLALNATSTHDTKRGEDVRSRLNVLTELTDEWTETVLAWQLLNRPEADATGEQPELEAPDRNDEYFIYQTLIGAYPMPDQDEDDFPNRLKEYLQKALREAKRNSSWGAPDEAYEAATQAFAARLLDRKRPFWAHFQAFHRRVADFGIANSLAQVVLKCTCPGLPDVYQGCEGWDLSLVDPDNRRSVDFAQRQQALAEVAAYEDGQAAAPLWASRYDARIKLWLLYKLLNERKQQPDLFATGEYLPLTVTGAQQQHVMAFARRQDTVWYVVAVPLGLAELCTEQQTDAVSADWGDTSILLPTDAPVQWQHRLLNTSGQSENGIAVSEVFGDLPLAVLRLS